MDNRPFEAQRQLEQYLRRFRIAFQYQYNISAQEEDIHSFSHHACGKWHVHCGAQLPTHRLKDIQGRDIGLVLGIAVGPLGLLDEKSPFLPLDSTHPQFWKKFEDYIVDVAGRFAFVITRGAATRMYVDPVGMIGAVYNKQDRFVAASPLLALKRPVEQNPKFDPKSIKEDGGKYSLFHTVDRHVTRQMPNHYLDLSTFKEHRFWPKSGNFAEPERSRLSIYSEIEAIAKSNIGAIAAAHTTSMPVSGGQDSRLILSFAKPHLQHIDQVYTHINNYATRIDGAVGKALCEKVDAPHESHDKKHFEMRKWETVQTEQMYDVAVGFPSNAPKEYLNGVIKGVTEGSVILRGHQTDILRAVYVFAPETQWRDVDWQIERLLIVPRTKFTPDVVDAFEDDFKTWQATLPENAMKKAADFMFLEVYYNSTVGATFPALWRNFYMSPFNSRRLIGLALSIPEKSRRKSEPVFDIIQRSAPELATVPFDFEIGSQIDLLSDEDHVHSVTLKRRRRTFRRLKDLAAPLDGAGS